MVKKIKEKSKLNRQTTKFVKLANESYDKSHTYSMLKYELPIEKSDVIVSSLIKNKNLIKHIMNNPFPETYQEIGNNFPLKHKPDSVEDIYWTANLLAYFTEKIDKFLEYKKSFEFNFLKGEYIVAESVLSLIEKEIGVSNWFISTKLLLLEEVEGMKMQKKFSQNIKKDNKIEGFTKVLTNYQSLKVEKNISYKKYEKALDEIMGLDLDERSKKHYALNLGYYLNFNNIKENDISNLVSSDNHRTIVDMFLNFQMLIENSFLKVEKSENESAINYALEKLFSKIPNSSLYEWSNFVLEKPIFNKKNSQELNLLDTYSLGKYKEALNQSINLFNNTLPNFETFEILVKSYMNLNLENKIFKGGSFLDNFMTSFQKIIRKDEGATEAYLELKKTSNILQYFTWTRQFYFFTIRSFSSSFNLITSDRDLNNFPTTPCNPVSLFYLPEKLKKDFLSSMEGKNALSVSYKLHKALYLKDEILLPNLEASRLDKYRGKIYLSRGDCQNAINIFKDGYSKSSGTLKLENLIGLINSYMYNKDYLKCLELVASTYIQNPNIYPLYPFKEIYSEIKDIYCEDFSSHIAVPIFYYIYNKHHDIEAITELKDAFEDFLDSQNLEKASEIESKLESFDLSKATFFLEKICTFEIMDTNIAFSSTSEVERELILINQLLSKINPKKRSFYSNEIKESTQKLYVKKRLREIEKSKIYVDVNGLKNALEITLKESFNRYKEFEKNSDHNSSDKPIIVSLNNQKNIKPVNDEGEINKHTLTIPDNEKYNLLKNIFEEVRDCFVSSPKYGLDGYLSVGIRHGTLASNLRKPFNQYKLITQKNKETDENYKINEYWNEKYKDIGEGNLEILNSSLNRFSQNVNYLIDYFKNEIIQIKTEKRRSLGYFDFSLKKQVVLFLQEEVKEIELFEEFLDFIIEILWQTADFSLKKIQEFIEFILKTKFSEYFDDLEKDLSSLELKQLRSNIRQAKTELINQLDFIASWFTRREELISKPFELDLPLDIAEASVNYFSLDKIKVRKDLNETFMFEGETLSSYVNIFVIIFENIANYSKVKNYPIKVDVICRRGADELLIKIVNYNEIPLEEVKIKQKLESILKDVAELNHLDKISNEGGTGLYKIAKILKYDLGWKNKINYKIENGNFILTIKIDLEGKYEDSNSRR